MRVQCRPNRRTIYVTVGQTQSHFRLPPRLKFINHLLASIFIVNTVDDEERNWYNQFISLNHDVINRIDSSINSLNSRIETFFGFQLAILALIIVIITTPDSLDLYNPFVTLFLSIFCIAVICSLIIIIKLASTSLKVKEFGYLINEDQYKRAMASDEIGLLQDIIATQKAIVNENKEIYSHRKIAHNKVFYYLVIELIFGILLIVVNPLGVRF